MRARLRGAVGGSSRPAPHIWGIVFADVRRGEKEARSPVWFPWAPLALLQTHGTNRYIFIPLPPVKPPRVLTCYPWVEITFFYSIHSKTFNYTWSRQLRKRRGWTLSRLPLLNPRSTHITPLDRIPRLILLSSSCVILIAPWASLMQLSLPSAVTAHKNADHTAIRLADYMIFN